jgi:DNA-binding response OmpR family regulator
MTGRLRVAFIHEYEPLRRLVLELLPDADMDVYVAERSSVRLRALAAWDPDVVLIDPIDGSGSSKSSFTVATAIRHHPALGTKPMIVLSAERHFLPAVHDLQPAAILALPFTADELVRVIRRVRSAPVHPATKARRKQSAGKATAERRLIRR